MAETHFQGIPTPSTVWTPQGDVSIHYLMTSAYKLSGEHTHAIGMDITDQHGRRLHVVTDLQQDPLPALIRHHQQNGKVRLNTNEISKVYHTPRGNIQAEKINIGNSEILKSVRDYLIHVLTKQGYLHSIVTLNTLNTLYHKPFELRLTPTQDRVNLQKLWQDGKRSSHEVHGLANLTPQGLQNIIQKALEEEGQTSQVSEQVMSIITHGTIARLREGKQAHITCFGQAKRSKGGRPKPPNTVWKIVLTST